MKKYIPLLITGLSLPVIAMASSQVNGVSTNPAPQVIPSQLPGSPLMAAIVHRLPSSYDGMNKHFCDAVFLGGRYWLTSAQCADLIMFGPEVNADVIVGIKNLDQMETDGKKIAIKNIYRHPLAKDLDTTQDGLYDYNIAVLELDEAVAGTAIEPASAELVNSLVSGQPLQLTGWRELGDASTGVLYSATQHQTEVSYVERSTCQNVGEYYASTGGYFESMAELYASIEKDYASLGEDVICAGDYIHAAVGDRASPLIINDQGTPKLAGITSWGNKSFSDTPYGVYTNVGLVHDWIENIITGQWATPIKADSYSDEKVVLVDVPVENHSQQPFTITDINLPEGVTLDSNWCDSELQVDESCSLTFRVNKEEAGHMRENFDYEIQAGLFVEGAPYSYIPVSLWMTYGYPIKVSSNSDNNVTLVTVPVDNQHDEPFSVTEVYLPDGVTIHDNHCRTPVAPANTCNITFRVNKEEAGIEPGDVFNDLSVLMVTDNAPYSVRAILTMNNG
ncbi:Trypsin [Vibrio aerogenes CECT 7868]|uniref:Trypsin n=1 Tax=Vibrio aerogenes CECT 7868 TaxID=1216006 RepID=A0A1M5UKY1_9VIBR|nr:trypsin-like serine protease [Vibrio aerogenes]SHH63659.1 Trypsin [Vibrio aerogenes CECT 7868]